MTDNRLNILYTTEPKNVVHSFSSATTLVLTYPIGMWGEEMFGSPGIWGALYSNTYHQGDKNITSLHDTMNIQET